MAALPTKEQDTEKNISELCLKRSASAPSLTNCSNSKCVTLGQLHQTSGTLNHVQILLTRSISTEIYTDIPVGSEEIVNINKDISRNIVGDTYKHCIRRLSLPNNRNDDYHGFGDYDVIFGDTTSNAKTTETSKVESQQPTNEAENHNDSVETSKDVLSESCSNSKEMDETLQRNKDTRQNDEYLPNPEKAQLATISHNHIEDNILIVHGIQLHNSNFDEECNTTIRNGGDASHQNTKPAESDSDDMPESPAIRSFVNSAATNQFKSAKSDELIPCSAQPSERSFRLPKSHSSESFHLQNPLSSLTEYEEILSTRPRVGFNLPSSISRGKHQRPFRSSQSSSYPHSHQPQYQTQLQRQHFLTDRERTQTQFFNLHSRSDQDKGYESQVHENSPRLSSISDRRRRLLTSANSLDHLKSKSSCYHASSHELSSRAPCSTASNPISQTCQFFNHIRRNQESNGSKKFDSNQNQTPLPSNLQSTSQSTDSPVKSSHLSTCHGLSKPHLNCYLHSGQPYGRRHMHHEHSPCAGHLDAHSRFHVHADQRYHCHGDSTPGLATSRDLHHHHFPPLSLQPHVTSPNRHDYQKISSSHQHHPMPPTSLASEIAVPQQIALPSNRFVPGTSNVIPSYGSVQRNQPSTAYERPIYQSTQANQYLSSMTHERPMFQNPQVNEYHPGMPIDRPTFQLPLQNSLYQSDPNLPQTAAQLQANQFPFVNPNIVPNSGPSIPSPINSTVPLYGTPGAVQITSPLKQSVSGIRAGARNPSTFYFDANSAEIIECQQQPAQPIESIERVIRYIPTNESYTIHASTSHPKAELDSKIITCENEINKNEMVLDQLRVKLSQLKGMR